MKSSRKTKAKSSQWRRVQVQSFNSFDDANDARASAWITMARASGIDSSSLENTVKIRVRKRRTSPETFELIVWER